MQTNWIDRIDKIKWTQLWDIKRNNWTTRGDSIKIQNSKCRWARKKGILWRAMSCCHGIRRTHQKKKPEHARQVHLSFTAIDLKSIFLLYPTLHTPPYTELSTKTNRWFIWTAIQLLAEFTIDFTRRKP